ncbi:hypothetical protein PR048_009006 [Dryococelus australis]|uniref:Uncharacterized protein n=1 Tax=Dryococelus australis TaxID=614101 RepID=A0ABQ9HZ27_9NEOP|nr:hypothetical protein PR048_009006 [Dryococelus australis]
MFYLCEDTPLPCSPEEIVAHAVRILPLHSPDCSAILKLGVSPEPTNEAIIQESTTSVRKSATKEASTLKDVASMLATAVRKSSRSSNKCTASADTVEYYCKFLVFKARYYEIIELDHEIKKLLYENEDIEKYNEKFHSLKGKVDVLNQPQVDAACSVSETSTTSRHHFRLPKLELCEISKLIGFWVQFSLIDGDSKLSNEETFLYLLQATVPKSMSRVIVESFPPSRTQTIVLQVTKMVPHPCQPRNQIFLQYITALWPRSYILDSLAGKMNYGQIEGEYLVHYLFGVYSMGLLKHSCYKARLQGLNSDFACKFSVLDQTAIASATPFAIPKRSQKFGIYLIEDIPGPIGVLIGADIAEKIYSSDRVVLSTGVISVQTLFGWILMGTKKKPPATCCSTNLVTTSTIASVTTGDVTDLWKLEAIVVSDTAEKKNSDMKKLSTLEHFERTVEFVEVRYQVRFPWYGICCILIEMKKGSFVSKPG